MAAWYFEELLLDLKKKNKQKERIECSDVLVQHE